MIEIEHISTHDAIVVTVSENVTKRQMEAAVPEIENAMELANSPICMLIRLEGFQGGALGALARDIEFEWKHRGEFGRIAVVGDTKLEEWGVRFVSPFAKSDVRFFDVEAEKDARRWLHIP